MTKIITLPDGRNLAFAKYGRANGEPALFCHPAPGSRLHVSEDMSRVADEMGIWLIVPDRPGYGLSDVKENNQIDEFQINSVCVCSHIEKNVAR